jgi:hypothetical protein
MITRKLRGYYGLNIMPYFSFMERWGFTVRNHEKSITGVIGKI